MFFRSFKSPLLMTLFVLLLCFAGVNNEIFSCDTINGENSAETTGEKRILELKDFDFLKVGMSYEEIINMIGKPDGPAGSGYVMVKYILKDGDHVILNFGTGEKGLNLVNAILEKPNREWSIIVGSPDPFLAF